MIILPKPITPDAPGRFETGNGTFKSVSSHLLRMRPSTSAPPPGPHVEAPWPWRLTLAVGEHVPLHCTASGKLFLAQMPTKQRDQLISQLSLTPMTENTITSQAAVQEECATIATAGHALDRQEFIAGLLAIAVPIRDENGAVRAALALHAPISRLSSEQAVARLPPLYEAAKRLSKLL